MHKKEAEALLKERTSALLPGQTVRVEGREEEFVVLRIDRERHLADLLRQGSVRKVESGIPLALLTPVNVDPQPELKVSA